MTIVIRKNTYTRQAKFEQRKVCEKDYFFLLDTNIEHVFDKF